LSQNLRRLRHPRGVQEVQFLLRRSAAGSGGAFIGQHGFWNRQLNGYRVVFVPSADGHPLMPAQPFLNGFLDANNKIRGRPVGVAVDKRGALLVADDVGNIVWRIAPAAQTAKS
jgi:glucose/arabinose dehydrogenase